jgi:hypothetical protein
MKNLIYLLGIMEVVCIIDIFYLSWVDLLLKRPKIVFAVLHVVWGGEYFSSGMLSSFLILFVNCLPGGFGKTLTVEVLTCYLRNVASIPRNMLSLDVGVGTSDPVWTLVGVVAVLKGLGLQVFRWWVYLVVVLLVIWFWNGYIDVVFWVWNPWFCDDFIDTACSATEDFVFLGNVTGVAREVVFAIVDECFRRHF